MIGRKSAFFIIIYLSSNRFTLSVESGVILRYFGRLNESYNSCYRLQPTPKQDPM